MVPVPTDRIGDCSLYLSPCLEVLRQVPENSLEACVTDPPAGISFMGKKFDTFRDRAAFITWLTEIMAEVYRVLKPGAHALAWALPRTSHWTAMACEDAGFEVRDSILHIFSSGFPKSQNIARAIDKTLGVESKVIGTVDPRSKYDGHIRHSEAINTHWREAEGREDTRDLSKSIVTEPATDAAKQYQGWGSALSPSHETWWLCRKPLSEPTLAQNVLKWGVGGINVDATRIPSTGESRSREGKLSAEQRYTTNGSTNFAAKPGFRGGDPQGRWPKNTLLDGSETVAAQFPVTDTAPVSEAAQQKPRGTGGIWSGTSNQPCGPQYSDTGSAARFFYAAKASKADRGVYNTHPTCKNTALMQYLIRLITPAGGTILDPFAGSGSTGKAALLEGKKFLGIEREPEYYAIMVRRLTEAAAQPVLFP